MTFYATWACNGRSATEVLLKFEKMKIFDDGTALAGRVRAFGRWMGINADVGSIEASGSTVVYSY